MHAYVKKRLKGIGDSKVFFDVPMSHYTTLRVGGNAEALCKVKNLKALREMTAFLKDEKVPYLVAGRGSNLLVRDEGLKGVVIMLNGAFTDIENHASEAPYIISGAGVSLHKLVHFCTEQGLAGAEFLAGIPGSLGGSVVMNAGSWGHEMKDIVGEITILTSEGIAEKRDCQRLAFTYRGLGLHAGEIILSAMLNLSFEHSTIIRERVDSLMQQRRKRYPLDMPSAGSIFKNPEGDYAGRLIDAAGLKGKTIGGAMISPQHANIIVNKGNASSSDILALMDLAVGEVLNMFHIRLSPEIKVVGEM